MAPRTHVVGAGIAGLAAAVALVRARRAVTLYEASGAAGGRCRSYPDAKLGCALDNGNHLLLSGNRATLRYLAEIGAGDALTGPEAAAFPFLDLGSGQRWCLRPGAGRLPWWIFDPSRRVPGTGVADYLSVLRLAAARADRTVAECVGEDSVLFRRFWEPLAVAALNTPARAGSARLLLPVLRETFARGEGACRPRVARTGLSDAFVDPALAWLRRRGAAILLRHRLRGIDCADGRACRLDFGAHAVPLRDGDSVVLALPPPAAARMVPGLTVPEGSHAIVNVHFRLPVPAGLPAGLPLLGLIGGTAQWLFVRGEIASVTVSAADALADEAAEAIAAGTWRDVATALALDRDAVPAYSVVKEKRATFAQTPEQARRRPGTRTGLGNLHLAGDWIDTGLPATIESAVRSGRMAARAVAGGAARDRAFGWPGLGRAGRGWRGPPENLLVCRGSSGRCISGSSTSATPPARRRCGGYRWREPPCGSSSPSRGGSAPASSGPWKSSNGRCNAAASPSTCATRSSTTSMSSTVCATRARVSSSGPRTSRAAPSRCSAPTACRGRWRTRPRAAI